MIGIKLDKRLFFDRRAVIERIGKVGRHYLASVGGYTRKVAQRSMRKVNAKKNNTTPPSEPGTPPRARIGLLRKRLFFALDPHRQSVVVGPERLGRSNVPELHERGGTIIVRDRRGRPKVARYAARPYMGPALDATLPHTGRFWREAQRKG